MPQLSPSDILGNMARLKGSPSSANMENYADIFAGPAEGAAPSAFEQHSRGQLADSVETTLGAGPAIAGLRRSADERRLQDRTNIQAEDADYMENGLDRGMAHANVEGQVGDVLSESKARRGFLPFASQAHDQAFGDAAAQADIRYGQPARIHADAALGSAAIRGRAQVDAAETRKRVDPTQELFRALEEMIRQGGGKLPSDVDVEGLKRLYGGVGQ
jgi:hypothetical protein